MQHAFTAMGSMSPAYINVTLLENGNVRVIVRGEPAEGAHQGTSGSIEMSRDDFISVFGPVMIELA